MIKEKGKRKKNHYVSYNFSKGAVRMMVICKNWKISFNVFAPSLYQPPACCQKLTFRHDISLFSNQEEK